MKLPRRQFLQLAAGAATLPVISRMAWAQSYPVRPVRIIVPVPAGGTVDTKHAPVGSMAVRAARPTIHHREPARRRHQYWYRGGGACAPGRLHPALAITATNVTNATIYDNLNFNFIRDIAPVASTVRVPLVLEVHPSVPARSVPELIAYAKANPGKINMASAGNGTPSHVSGELFAMMTGIDKFTHVPYRGDAPATTDLLGGQVQVVFRTLCLGRSNTSGLENSARLR